MNSSKHRQQYERLVQVYRKREVELSKKEVLLEQANALIEQYQKEIAELETQEDILMNVVQLCQSIASDRNSGAKAILESILNDAVDRVELDTKYNVKLLEPETKQAVKGLYVKLVERETGYERTPLKSTGTMVAQLISFLMTVIVVKMSGARRILIMDEVLSGFNDLHSIKEFGDILVALAENEGFQFVMVEHKSQLREVEKLNIINVEKKNGELIVKSIEKGGVSA